MTYSERMFSYEKSKILLSMSWVLIILRKIIVAHMFGEDDF